VSILSNRTTYIGVINGRDLFNYFTNCSSYGRIRVIKLITQVQVDRLLYEKRSIQVDKHKKCSCISCYCIAANICGHQFVTYFSAASIIGVNDGVKQVFV